MRVPSVFHDTLLFDLDGTLVDSVDGLHVAAVASAAVAGGPVPTHDFVRNAIGRGVDMLIHRVASGDQDGRIGPEIHARSRARFDEVYAESCLAGTSIRLGVRPVLEEFRRQGRRLVIATNKPRRPARILIQHLDLVSLVDDVVCPDDAGVRKPDPAFAAHALGGRTESTGLLVGDSSIDAETARRAGIPFVAIRGGYDEGRRIDDLQPPPDRIVDEPRDLPGAIASLEDTPMKKRPSN